MDHSSPVQNRRFRRSNVFLKATLESAGASIPILLKNLSQEGALVQGDDLPPEGTRLLFHRQGLSVPSRVAWTHCNYAGLEFDVPLFPRELLPHIPKQQQKPPPLPAFRRPGLGCKPLTPAERLLIEQWATGGSAVRA